MDITRVFLLLVFLFQGIIPPLMGQEQDPDDSVLVQSFGGPQSVAGQLTRDQRHKSDVLKGYFDFKDRLNKELGLAYGIDYNPIIQGATASLGELVAASGAFRIFGSWNAVGRNSQNKGSLVLKVENRHRLGTKTSAQGLAGEIGYAGLTSVPYSDIGWALTNLYWEQRILRNRLAFIVGVLDPADYSNVYGLVDPWNDFYNLIFSTGTTIPLPDQGIGVAVRATIRKNWYVLLGLSDANANPARPKEFFDNFFQTAEYFKQVELGWYGSFEDRFTRNIHLNLWHIDARNERGIPDGWGLAFSFSENVGASWEPFFRFGYSEDGGAIMSSSIAIGSGYNIRNTENKLSLGLSWGRPMESTYEQELRDQYTIELYYRTQVWRILTLTPDLQLLIDPALNPDTDVLLVYGLRGRIAI